MLTTWRIVGPEHEAAAFDGELSRIFGGRWNSPGTAMVYTSSSGALAVLEILVRAGRRGLRETYLLFSCAFDERLVTTIEPTRLPDNWRKSPGPRQLRAIGSEWVSEARSAVLRVPSAVIPIESNYLLNPAHADFGAIAIGAPIAFDLDPRLLS